MSPLALSGSICTSERKDRTVEVSGTTWITVGSPSRIRWAVTTTAGCAKPAWRPTGRPRSSSTTSPELSIEPSRFVVTERGSQLLAHSFLAETAHR